MQHGTHFSINIFFLPTNRKRYPKKVIFFMKKGERNTLNRTAIQISGMDSDNV